MNLTKKTDWLYYAPAASAGETATIQIFDQIGEDWFGGSGLSGKQFSDVLNEVGNGPLLVEINSPGGNVWDGLSIYNQLRGRRAPVTTRVVGIAASIASIIALAGDKVEMADAALMMIHDPSGMASGTSEDMRKMADALDQHAEVLVGVYAKKTGKSPEAIRAAMKAETWFTTQEAIAFGLVDKPIKQLAMAAKWHPRAVTKTAPETVKNNLRRGLEQYAEGLAGEGLEKATVLEAESLVAGEAPTEAKVQKANAWWGRNERFLEAEPNTPADVAANLWGGAAGRDWFRALYAQIEREEGEDEDESIDDSKKISPDSTNASGQNGVTNTPQPTQQTDTHMSDNTPVAAAAPAAAPAASVDLNAILAKLSALEASLKAPAAAPAPEPVRPVIENLGNPLLEQHRKMKAGADRRKWLIENHSELIRQNKLIAPQNGNTFAAGLVVDYLADAVITEMGTKLAMVGNFTRNVGLDNLRPRATVQVKKFVQAGSSATVDNATNFETSNDSELAATSVTVNQISKLFTVTQQELNQGFALADLAAGSADVFALGISKKITAVMTSANYGAGTTIGTAANFDTSDLPAILALAKNYRQKLLLLDGGHLARLQFSAAANTFPDARYGPLNNGLFGFEAILEQNDWTGAIANTAGFVCGRDAIAIASGLPVGMIAGEFVEQRTVESQNGLSVLLSVWYSRATRAHMASFDIMFGVAAGDKTQAEVLITA